MNVNSGIISRRALNFVIAKLEVRNRMYLVTAYTANFVNKSEKSNKSQGKLYNNYIDVEFDPEIEIHHLPLVVELGDDIECNKNSIEKDLKKKTKKKIKYSKEKVEKMKEAGRRLHRIFGHTSASNIHGTIKATSGIENEFLIDNAEMCLVCSIAKLTRKSSSESRTKATRVGEIVHADIIGPLTPSTFHTQNRYILVAMDGYSRFLQVFVMKTRDETPKMLDEAFRVIQAQHPGPGRFSKLRCDQGGEFDSDAVTEVLAKYGAKQQFAETDVHEHNASAERVIRTCEDKLRSLIYDSGFPSNMWGQLIDTVAYIYNRTAHSDIKFETPYAYFYDKKPKTNHMKIIGSRCYVYTVKVPRGRKCDPRSSVQYLVGYTDTGYRTYDPLSGKTTEQCLVRIDENNTYATDFPLKSSRAVIIFPDRNVPTLPDNQAGGDFSRSKTVLKFRQEGVLPQIHRL